MLQVKDAIHDTVHGIFVCFVHSLRKIFTEMAQDFANLAALTEASTCAENGRKLLEKLALTQVGQTFQRVEIHQMFCCHISHGHVALLILVLSRNLLN